MRSHHTSLSLLALLAALLPAGCADQDPSLLLTGYYFATGEADEMTGALINCSYEATVGGDALVSQDAAINLQALSDGGQPGSPVGKNVFLFGANVQNRLQPNASGGGSLRLDTNTVTLKAATINFLFSEPVQVDRVFSVTIGPNGAAGFGIPLVNGSGEVDDLKAAIAAEGVGPNQIVTVTAEITVTGTLLDGTDVESNVLEFPVNLCANCQAELQTTPACAAE